MNYVEWLRVRNTVRRIGIVLGVMLVLGLGARIWLGFEFGSDQSIIDRIQKDPGTSVTHTVYQGQQRTIIVNPREHVRVTIDDRADGGRSITIVEPKSDEDDQIPHMIGSVSIKSTSGPVTRTTIIDTNGTVPLAFYLAFAYIVGLIVATIFGAAFARENNGHLEIAFLRPISRELLALEMMGADLAGIVAAEILTVIALIVGQSFFEFPHVDLSGVTLTFLTFVVLVPLAWYMFLNAASASLKRGAGAVIGFSWPVCAVIIVLAHLNLHGTSLGQAIHAIAMALASIVPLNYAALTFADPVRQAAQSITYQQHLIIPALLVIVYGALAIVQWRRVEA